MRRGRCGRRDIDGALTIVGAEAHRPYDRPPLSKELLAGTVTVDDLALERDGEDLGADWRLGVRAERFQVANRRIALSDGSTLEVDGVVIATGAAARPMPGTGGLAGVHVCARWTMRWPCGPIWSPAYGWP